MGNPPKGRLVTAAMTLSANALFLPLRVWVAPAAAILVVQVAITWAVFRPGRRGLLRAAVALLLADTALVVSLRACVGVMGRMDYSEQFLRWRLWFLAMGILLLAVPLPLWAAALRAAGMRRRRAAPAPIRPVLGAVLAMWLACGAIVFLMGGEISYLPRAARVTPVEVQVAGLPQPIDGFRLAVIADLHVGPLMTPARVRKRLSPLRRMKADALVVLGDITDEYPAYQPAAVDLIADYAIPGRTFVVPGNFDVGAGTDSLREECDRRHLTYLENESTTIRKGSASLSLAGLGDCWTGNGDLERCLSEVPKGQPVVLLSHSPDIIEEAAARGVALVLSGHLHGGQVVVPFAGPAIGMSRYGTRFAAGHWRVGETALVVTRGVGEEAVPLRLWCPPEVLLVTLRTAR
jgi:predicted MPP superfamily phosphohydrolase